MSEPLKGASGTRPNERTSRRNWRLYNWACRRSKNCTSHMKIKRPQLDGCRDRDIVSLASGTKTGRSKGWSYRPLEHLGQRRARNEEL